MKRPIANKLLGQHYLVSATIINSICNDFSDASEIIEIGPGPAVLTKILADKKKPMMVIEKDNRFLPHLEEILPSKGIIIADALKINLEELIKTSGYSNNVWLVSNLPYNAATPLLISFIQTPQIKSMTLMFQKEVGIKIVPTNKSNTMNSLEALCNNFFSTSVLCKVPPGAFTPPPKVDSIVISFNRKENPQISLKEFSSFEKFLRSIFGYKRKQLGTVLKKGYDNLDILSILERLNISPQVRAENLSQDEVIGLYRNIVNQ